MQRRPRGADTSPVQLAYDDAANTPLWCVSQKDAIMKIPKLGVVAATVLVVANLGALPAHAEGLYAGGSLGGTNYPNDVNGIDGGSSDISGKLFGGYQFTPNFALEAGATELGRFRAHGDRVDGHALFLDAVGILPLDDKWSLLGRVGLAHADLDTSSGDGKGSGIKVGLGAQYALSHNVALRAEWERYHPSLFEQHPDIDQYTVGLRIGF